MACLTLSWSHFDVIKWNGKALLKVLKQVKILFLGIVKTSKLDIFSVAAPLEHKGRQEHLQRHSLQNSIPWKLANFINSFLSYIFTPRKTSHLIILSYFDSGYGILTKIKWKMHCVDTLYLKFRRYFL